MVDITEIYHFTEISNHMEKASEGSSKVPGATELTTCSRHCELTLALQLLQHFEEQGITGPISIGVSKASCYWCHVFPLELNEYLEQNQIVTYGTHGKSVKGWLPPQHLTERYTHVNHNVLRYIGEKVEEVFRKIKEIPRKKSDSRSITNSLARHLRVREEEAASIFSGI